VDQVEPPPTLLPAVMRGVRAAAQPRAGREGVARAILAAFARRPAFAYGSAMAAGILIGALSVVGLGDASLRAPGAASGTALPSARLRPAAVLETQAFAVDGLRGEATTRSAQDVVIAELRLEGEGSADVTLEFEEESLFASGIERSGAPAGTWTLAPGRLSFSGGAGTYRLLLSAREPGTPPLRLRVRGAGTSVDRTLATGAARP
jgi:hypothetical protein